MKFLLDENFPLPLYHRLSSSGYEVEYIIVLGQRGLSDSAIIERIAREDLVFLTSDLEFLSAAAGLKGTVIVSRVSQNLPIARRVEIWFTALQAYRTRQPAGQVFELLDTGEVIPWNPMGGGDNGPRERPKPMKVEGTSARGARSSIRRSERERRLPHVVVHADWSSAPRKRWMALAVRRDGVYHLAEPALVGDIQTLVRRIVDQARGGGAVLGLDFPIGVPYKYARLARINNFLKALPRFGNGRWKHFYCIAKNSVEISVRRPFYPFRPAGTHADLLSGLGLASMVDLLRQCERPYSGRGRACPLFWTLGGNQVGRAAIVGWRDVLAPSLADRDLDVAFWPFQGKLATLLSKHGCVIVETYPADACVQIGLPAPGRGWSKQKQQGRCDRYREIDAWASGKPIRLEAGLDAALKSGFGTTSDGEDRFDAVIGLLGMLNVILGNRPDGAPNDVRTRAIEGWILGMVLPASP